jgi:hypothetical protein
MYCDRSRISAATEKIMSRVFDAWRTSPLTQDFRSSDCGSPTSSAGTNAGPSGLNVSQHLPFDH